MNSYTETVRVGVAGATGYAGVELLRLLGRHPGVRIAAAMGSPGAAPRHVPALTSLWDATVDGLDIEALADGTDAVFLALPEDAAAEVAPAAARARQARVRSVGRVPPPRRRAASAVVSENARAALVSGLRPDRALPRSAARFDAGRLRRAAIRPPRSSRCCRCCRPGCSAQPIIIDAKSGVSGAGKTPTERTHFSESHGSLSAYGVFGHRHVAEIEQELGAPVTFVPHLRAARPRHPRDDLRDAEAGRGRGGHRRRAARRVRAVAVRAAHRGRAAGDQARRVHQLLRHRLAGRTTRRGSWCSSSCLDNLVKGAAGQAVQNFNVAFGFDERMGLN